MELVDFYEMISATTKRLEMTDHLVNLFKSTPGDVIDKVVYLTQGKLYPDFAGIEIGMAEKMALRALAMASGLSMHEVKQELNRKGDIGLAAENLLKTKKQTALHKRELLVQDVYYALDRIAGTTGAGSVDMKVRTLSGLLSDAGPVEAKYIMRTVTGKMRLGIADMTILDALARAFASKDARRAIERAYNLTSDLGDVARALSREGIEGIKEYHSKVGRPVRMMLAQRLERAGEIVEKLGKAICEWKYDGERIQIHKFGDEVSLFSRRLENITGQYPDVAALVRHNLKVNEAIIEGECVAVDPDTGTMLPFQQLMHRRRKYGIEEAAKKFPAHMYLFDALLVEGEDLTQKPLIERRVRLRDMIAETNGFRLVYSLISDNVEEIETFFESAIENGCEGLILKDEDSIYQAGARSWLWIKLKRSFQSKMIEPIDVVIVGALMGRGRRSGSYGALLVAVYDHERDVFPTITKLGSGFTDEDLKNLPEILSPYRLEHKHARVESKLEADIWFEPALVMEMIGDELTLSPVHPCAYNEIRENAGIAVRFPRFTHRWRKDKAPEDATTVDEIVDMYKAQLKKIG
ncbi:MAG: ATP-dependent DNA ligase [Candidatus Methanoperedens sp.]|nr:ATP-dependent DNA ligase [Candidatus Methanoperedens sp.]